MKTWDGWIKDEKILIEIIEDGIIGLVFWGFDVLVGIFEKSIVDAEDSKDFKLQFLGIISLLLKINIYIPNFIRNSNLIMAKINFDGVSSSGRIKILSQSSRFHIRNLKFNYEFTRNEPISF